MRFAFGVGLSAFCAIANTCCPLTDEEKREVFLKAEKIVIHYDPSTQIEHFVRQVTFDGQSRVGFIVPSPTKPTIALADDKIFQVAADAADAAYSKWTSSKQFDSASASAGAAGEIEIVDRLKVGKFDVTIVRAKDRLGLVKWLKARKFAMPEGFEPWIQPYIEEDMFLAVYEFKGGGKAGLISETIRTTFKTDKPLYPYRIPKQLVSDDYHEFRCYYISREPARSSGPEAKISFALAPSAAKQIYEGFKLPEQLPNDNWVMTEFTSARSSFTDQDLYFVADPNPEGATLVSRPTVPPMVLVGVLASAGGVGLALLRRRR